MKISKPASDSDSDSNSLLSVGSTKSTAASSMSRDVDEDDFVKENEACKVGDFVMVAFSKKQRVSYYVGQISTIDDDDDDEDI